MGKFVNGASVNVHCKAKKLKHIRIKAGAQRDRYLHDIVFEAKILGRREAWARIYPEQPDPPADDDRFYTYIDTVWETVDHHDQDSLNNSPANLQRMTRAANTAKANRHNTERRRKEKDVPF